MQKQEKYSSDDKIYLLFPDAHRHLIFRHDLFNHDGLTKDGIEAFIELAGKEKLSFFE